MDDKNIIKALEICAMIKPCADCPLAGYGSELECKYKLMQLALDLVQRQQEQIEALKAGQESLQRYYEKGGDSDA